jgi:hypothetical protein
MIELNWIALIVSVGFHFMAWPAAWTERELIVRLFKSKSRTGLTSFHYMWFYWDRIFAWLALALSAVGYFFILKDPAFGAGPYEYDLIIGLHFAALVFYRVSVLKFVDGFQDKGWRIVAAGIVAVGVLAFEVTALVFFAIEVAKAPADLDLLTETEVMGLIGQCALILYVAIVLIVFVTMSSDRIQKSISLEWRAERAGRKALNDMGVYGASGPFAPPPRELLTEQRKDNNKLIKS